MYAKRIKLNYLGAALIMLQKELLTVLKKILLKQLLELQQTVQ